jgi:hypothetical protein
MYRCGMCASVVPSGTAASRLVLETRLKEYPFRPKANRIVYRKKDGKLKAEWPWDPGGTGWEIVREVLACADCRRRHSIVTR